MFCNISFPANQRSLAPCKSRKKESFFFFSFFLILESKKEVQGQKGSQHFLGLSSYSIPRGPWYTSIPFILKCNCISQPQTLRFLSFLHRWQQKVISEGKGSENRTLFIERIGLLYPMLFKQNKLEKNITVSYYLFYLFTLKHPWPFQRFPDACQWYKQECVWIR